LWEKDQPSDAPSAKVTLINRRSKIVKLPTTATTLDIIAYLGSHPNESVQIEGDGRTLTYERLNNKNGHMAVVRIAETGEEIPV
jgi:hypothetical protein